MGWVASLAIETAACGVAWKKGYEAHLSVSVVVFCKITCFFIRIQAVHHNMKSPIL